MRKRTCLVKERGSNLVEMALVMFLLVLLLMAVADFGRAFHTYIIITNAAREGARYASRFPAHESGIQEATVQEAANSGVTLETDDIIINGLAGAAGTPIRVEVDYEFPMILGALIGMDELKLRSSTEMVIFGLDNTGG
jgi:hypothetical protein